ncbi:uncharacterized protein LOC143975739 [Lithobates pipiens]
MAQRNGRSEEEFQVKIKEEEIPVEIHPGTSMTQRNVKFEEEEEELHVGIKEERLPVEISTGGYIEGHPTPRHPGSPVNTEDGLTQNFQDGKKIKVEVKEEVEEIKVRGYKLCKEEETSMEIGADGQYTRSGTRDMTGASSGGHVLPKPLSREEKGDGMARDVTQSDLIAAVQKKPELWDPEFPRYSDRVQKKKAWEEIFKSLTPNWDLLSRKQKENRGKDLSTRWRSLRDRYRRELTEERLAVQNGTPIRTKKRHPYARELAFLRRAMETREATSNLTGEEEESKAGHSNPGTPTEPEEASSSAPCTPQTPQRVQKARQPATSGLRCARRQQRTSLSCNDQILRLVKELTERQTSLQPDNDIFRNLNDPRVVFCRSLLPLLQRLPDDREMQAKEDIYTYLTACISTQRRDLPPPRMHLSTTPTVTSTCPAYVQEPSNSSALPANHVQP